MLSPKIRRDITRVIPFGVLWYLFSLIYVVLEKSLLGNLDHYPSSGVKYDNKKKKFNIVRLQVVKDLFIFSCYTGLVYIDVFNLTPANLIEKSENNIWIATNRQKTNEPVRVPILSKVLDIIEKYKGHPQALAEGKAYRL